MDTLAINASQQEIDLMIGEIDKNNDGTQKTQKHIYISTTTAARQWRAFSGKK